MILNISDYDVFYLIAQDDALIQYDMHLPKSVQLLGCISETPLFFFGIILFISLKRQCCYPASRPFSNLATISAMISSLQSQLI